MKKTIEVEKRIIFHGAVISIREDTLLYQDGTQDIQQVVQAPEGVCIVPITQNGTIIVTKEYRHNHGKIFGVPMGKMDKGEMSLDAAKRELLEELGITAQKWTLLSMHHNGMHEEGLNFFFLAEEISHGIASPEDDEEIELIEMTFQEALRLMDEKGGGFVDLRTRGSIWSAYIHLMHRNS